MRKVVIVDDEAWAIEGIKSAIDWESLGCEIAATFTSSEKALGYLTSNTVDLAILDIKMPKIDGLTLIDKLRSSERGLKIIIVSGMTEFETARRAISLGVEDFLVKPIDADSLRETVIRSIGEEKERQQAYPDIAVLNSQLARLKGQEGNTVVSNYLGLKKNYSYYFLLMADVPTDGSGLFGAIHTSGEALCFSVAGGRRIMAVFTDVFIEYQDALQLLRREYNDVNVGLSRQKSDLCEMSAAINECRQAYFRFFTRKTRCPHEYRESEWAHRNSVMQVMNQSLQEQNFVKLDMAITNIFSDAENLHIDELIMLGNSMLLSANTLSVGEKFEYLPVAESITSRFADVGALEDYLHRCVKALALRRAEAVGMASKRSIMPMIKEYIDKNFQDRISLTDLSEKFGISEKYLSKMFKKHTGENYAQYLNRVRVNFALQMLQKTSLSIREISEACGYSDYPYFARVFKKMVGVSATDVRRNLP